MSEKLGNQYFGDKLKNIIEKKKENPAIKKLYDEFYKGLEENHSYFLYKKLYNLSEKNSLETYKKYYEIAFKKLLIKGNSFEAKFNNYCAEKNITHKNSEAELYRYSDKKSLMNIQNIVGNDLIDNFNSIEKKDINNFTEKFEELRSIRINNRYLSDSYFIYMERAEEKEIIDKYSDKIDFKKLHNGEIKIEDFIKVYKKYGTEKNNKIVEGIKKHAEKLKIFETEIDYFNEKDFFNKEVFNKAIDLGLRFKKKGEVIFTYTTTGIFIGKLKKLENHKLIQFTEKYKNVKINTFLKLEIDTENKETNYFIEDVSYLDNLKIPKIYAERLKEFENKGYKFKLIGLDSNLIQLLVKKDGEIIHKITNNYKKKLNQYDLWLDILLKKLNSYDKKYNKKSKEKKIENPKLDIKNLKQNRINFINEIYEHTNGQTYSTNYWRIENLVKIGIKNKLPIDEIFSQISIIIPTISEKSIGVNLYSLYLEDLFKNPNSPDFLNKFNLGEKDYIKSSTSLNNMIFTIWSGIIKNNPKEALKNIVNLSDYYLSMHLNFSNISLTDKKGINYIIIYILKEIINIDVDLFKSDEMEKLFKKFPNLKTILEEGLSEKIENKILLGKMGNDGISSFENSADFGIVHNIRFRIKEEWFESKEFSEIEIKDLKLMISRNLAFQYRGKLDILKKEINSNLEALVKENLKIILKTREKIKKNKIIETDIYHIAHYGQDLEFDNFGTKPTQEALRKQSGKNKYKLFDAEDIFDKDKNVGEIYLKKYLNEFINNPKEATLLTEGHGNNVTFSVLNKYKQSDKLGLNKIGAEGINITPVDLAEIIIKREKIKKQKGITKPDKIIFAACRGDYAFNFYKEIFNRKEELGENFIIPIMITAAEAGQNSVGSGTNLKKEIPGFFLKYGLKIGSEEKTTYKTFFENQYDKRIQSNPSLFYPVKINGKYVIQQIG